MLFDIILYLLMLIFCLVCMVVYARWNFGVLESIGVPTEPRHWLFGNIAHFHQEFHHWEDLRRARKLGKIFGVYEGRTPMVYITDPIAIRKIFFTDSDIFNKRERDFGNPVINEAFEFLNGEKWKIVRNAMSPQFTTSKLKAQCQVVDRVCKEHMQALRIMLDSTGVIDKLDIHEFLAPLVIEIIAEALCGIEIKNARDPSNPFVKNMRIALFDNFMPGPLHRFIELFPCLVRMFPYVPLKATKVLENYVTEMLDRREASGEGKEDIVNAFLEFRRRARTDPGCKRLGVTDTTVFGAAMEFFTASFQGTCFTIRQLFFHLGKHPEVYVKVENELDSILEKHHGVISYESANEMEFIDACINETLRISPGFFRLDRTCNADWSYNGIKIPKGTHISIPLFPVHYNPEYFPDPEIFKPERFFREAKTQIQNCTFLRWGQGQRQCMGIRLAMLMMKIVLAHILKEYRIRKRADTRWVEKPGNHFLLTLEPLYFDLVQRTGAASAFLKDNPTF